MYRLYEKSVRFHFGCIFILLEPFFVLSFVEHPIESALDVLYDHSDESNFACITIPLWLCEYSVNTHFVNNP